MVQKPACSRPVFDWLIYSSLCSRLAKVLLVRQSHVFISWGELCYVACLLVVFHYLWGGGNRLTSYSWNKGVSTSSTCFHKNEPPSNTVSAVESMLPWTGTHSKVFLCLFCSGNLPISESTVAAQAVRHMGRDRWKIISSSEISAQWSLVWERQEVNEVLRGRLERERFSHSPGVLHICWGCMHDHRAAVQWDWLS